MICTIRFYPVNIGQKNPHFIRDPSVTDWTQSAVYSAMYDSEGNRMTKPLLHCVFTGAFAKVNANRYVSERNVGYANRTTSGD